MLNFILKLYIPGSWIGNYNHTAYPKDNFIMNNPLDSRKNYLKTLNDELLSKTESVSEASNAGYSSDQSSWGKKI